MGNIFLEAGMTVCRGEVSPLPSDQATTSGRCDGEGDFGIRGFDLAYAQGGRLDPWDLVVIVDVRLAHGEAPGTLYVIEPDRSGSGDGIDRNPHGMDPARVLNLAASMGTISAQVLVLGCEPHDFGHEFEGRIRSLSPPVRAAVEEASNMLLDLLANRQANPVRLQTMER